MKPRLVVVACVFIVSGCAQQPKVWMKPGSGTEEFNQARYACLQQGQQPYSTAYVGRYGGSASGGMTTNAGLYNACMEAGGWALVENASASSPAYAAAIKEVNEEVRALCRKPENYPYYSWAPCQIREVTPEQLADRTRVTAAEKPVIIRLKAELDGLNARIITAHRQYNEKYGNALATNIEQSMASADIVRREYLEGRLTRGEYNKRRRDILVAGDAEAVRVMKGS